MKHNISIKSFKNLLNLSLCLSGTLFFFACDDSGTGSDTSDISLEGLYHYDHPESSVEKEFTFTGNEFVYEFYFGGCIATRETGTYVLADKQLVLTYETSQATGYSEDYPDSHCGQELSDVTMSGSFNKEFDITGIGSGAFKLSYEKKSIKITEEGSEMEVTQVEEEYYPMVGE